MRDDGLDEAIRVAGGVGALARKIGISQPSVSQQIRDLETGLRVRLLQRRRTRFLL